jgi:protein gp37
VHPLLDTPAAVRWLSCEPLLGPVDLRAVPGLGGQYGHAGRHNGIGTPECPRISHHHHDERCRFPIDWVVVGGESGHGARPMHPDWARGIRDACAAASVPFFFKQWGEWLTVRTPSGEHRERVGKKRAGRELDGRTWDEYPAREARDA